MSLYRCTKCNAVENTATGGYWIQQINAHKDGKRFDPLCSECNPEIGAWHGQFPKRLVTPDYLEDARGFLWRPKDAATVPHLGPFKVVEV